MIVIRHQVVDTFSFFNDFAMNYLYMTSYTENLGLCHNYYRPAKERLLSLGENYVSYFLNSDRYEVLQMKERYESWARNNHDNNPYVWVN